MRKQVIVDTCSFIDFFHGAEDSLVPYLSTQDSILLSKVVRLELLKGASRKDRKALLTLFEGFKELPDFAPADLTEDILLRLHSRGLSLGFADLLILSDAIHRKSGLLTSDLALAKAADFLGVTLIKKTSKQR